MGLCLPCSRLRLLRRIHSARPSTPIQIQHRRSALSHEGCRRHVRTRCRLKMDSVGTKTWTSTHPMAGATQQRRQEVERCNAARRCRLNCHTLCPRTFKHPRTHAGNRLCTTLFDNDRNIRPRNIYGPQRDANAPYNIPRMPTPEPEEGEYEALIQPVSIVCVSGSRRMKP